MAALHAALSSANKVCSFLIVPAEGMIPTREARAAAAAALPAARAALSKAAGSTASAVAVGQSDPAMAAAVSSTLASLTAAVDAISAAVDSATSASLEAAMHAVSSALTVYQASLDAQSAAIKAVTATATPSTAANTPFRDQWLKAGSAAAAAFFDHPLYPCAAQAHARRVGAAVVAAAERALLWSQRAGRESSTVAVTPNVDAAAASTVTVTPVAFPAATTVAVNPYGDAADSTASVISDAAAASTVAVCPDVDAAAASSVALTPNVDAPAADSTAAVSPDASAPAPAAASILTATPDATDDIDSAVTGATSLSTVGASSSPPPALLHPARHTDHHPRRSLADPNAISAPPPPQLYAALPLADSAAAQRRFTARLQGSLATLSGLAHEAGRFSGSAASSLLPPSFVDAVRTVQARVEAQRQMAVLDERLEAHLRPIDE